MKNKLMLVAVSLVSFAAQAEEYKFTNTADVRTVADDLRDQATRFERAKAYVSTSRPVQAVRSLAAKYPTTTVGLMTAGLFGGSVLALNGVERFADYMKPAKELSRTQKMTNFVKSHKYSVAGTIGTAAVLGYLAYKGYFKNPFAKKAKKSAMTYAQRRAALRK